MKIQNTIVSFKYKNKNYTIIIMTEAVKIPKRIFIVPYRNRVQHKFFFCKYMSFILEDKNDYEIFFSHQCDSDGVQFPTRVPGKNHPVSARGIF